MTPGSTSGNVIRQNVVQWVARSVSAASSSRRSKRLNTASMVRKPKGNVHTMCTAKVDVYHASPRPSARASSATPKPTRRPVRHHTQEDQVEVDSAAAEPRAHGLRRGERQRGGRHRAGEGKRDRA